uniref:Uncharacterized protein n=1 Tax=Cacopsylla melanoneura TaxID=428564 RepID=A0A8D8ZC27_9HEMI
MGKKVCGNTSPDGNDMVYNPGAIAKPVVLEVILSGKCQGESPGQATFPKGYKSWTSDDKRQKHTTTYELYGKYQHLVRIRKVKNGKHLNRFAKQRMYNRSKFSISVKFLLISRQIDLFIPFTRP